MIGRAYKALIRFVLRFPKTMIALWVVVWALAATGVAMVKEEEDLMVFLPTNDPDVQLFRSASDRFGALRVALLGVQADPADPASDIFSPTTIAKIKAATDEIRNIHGVDRVLSVTSMTDVVPGEMGAEVLPMVDTLPTNAEEATALRRKVMSREQVVGNFVSKSGRAALIMVFLADGGVDRVVVSALRDVAKKTLAPLHTFYGGAPFAQRAIYEEAQADVRKLSPVALVLFFFVIILAYREPVGVVLTVVSVTLSTLVVIGGQGWFGEHFTVATSTLPVILFASGSSYAVHALGRYYLLRRDRQAKESIEKALEIVGPPLAIAGGTTAVGFFAFLATDVRPMRAFGIACGSGVLVCWLMSLTLVPAVLMLWPRPAQPSASLAKFGDALVWLWRKSQKQSLALLLVGAALAVGFFVPMLKVKVRMDPNAFFRKGSAPWQAERFLSEDFGGATFVQVWVSGDFDDPSTLREIARLEDYALTLPGVGQVASISQPLRLVSEAMGGGRRLPLTRKQAANLYFFLEGEAGVRSLVTENRKEILIQVRVRGDGRQVVEALEKYVHAELHKNPSPPTVDEVAQRLSWVAASVGATSEPNKLRRSLALLAPPSEQDIEWSQKRDAMVLDFLKSEEAPPTDDAAKEKIRAAASGGATAVEAALVAATKDPEEAKDAARRLSSRLEDERRKLATTRALPIVLNGMGLATQSEATARIAVIIDDLFCKLEAPPATPLPLAARIAGQPILDRGFSRSVGTNLDRSLVISLVSVLVLLLVLFRSLKISLICMAPATLTLVVMFGVMGLFGIDIDLGTSLVAGITTGAGADFAMHYLWYLREDSPEVVSRTVGPVMVLSILLVAGGFAVLALGESHVMHLFGILAALGMALSALFTCVFMPALLHRFAPTYGGHE